MRKQFITIFSIAIATIVVLSAAVVYAVPYFNSPNHIKYPALEHLHFRTQLVVDGQVVNFAESKFQEATPGACSEELPASPIHFHDGVDQVTHIHWKSITGGEVLKYYGWNFIGGSDGSLGSRFDSFLPANVPIHGNLLPNAPEGSSYYVYVGDETAYERKDWNNFINQKLEDFFGTQSNFGKSASANVIKISELLYGKAYAHGAEPHDSAVEGEAVQHSQEDLRRINNLIGNVVIFAQVNEPSEEEIKERFDNLTPLTASTCGG